VAAWPGGRLWVNHSQRPEECAILLFHTNRATTSRPALPLPRVSLGVHAGHNDDGLTVDTVKEAVGKALWDESAADVAVQGGACFWMFEHSVAR
jgi:hypothetical protein